MGWVNNNLLIGTNEEIVDALGHGYLYTEVEGLDGSLVLVPKLSEEYCRAQQQRRPSRALNPAAPVFCPFTTRFIPELGITPPINTNFISSITPHLTHGVER